MSNKSVAILDIRSYEVTFLIGARGVNGTFVFRDSISEKYEGYSALGFIDEQSFRSAVIMAVNSVRQNYEGIIKEIYIGVPAVFTKVYTKGHTSSFSSKRKISEMEINSLYESGLKELMAPGHYICGSNMYFALGDNRKYFNASDLKGISTTFIKGALSYYFADEKFYNVLESVLNELGFIDIHYIPETLAESNYLLTEKEREGYAFLLDIGFLSTSISVIYGNGIVHEECFDWGIGAILVELMQTFEIDYESAEEILSSANISGGIVSNNDTIWKDSKDNSYPVNKINETIKYVLDVLCEQIALFFEKYYRNKSMMNFTENPISLTGEGACAIKGISEHISNRLNRMTRIVNPDLPYYDKPLFSSRISLLNTALSKIKDNGLMHLIYNIFGGKKNVQ